MKQVRWAVLLACVAVVACAVPVLAADPGDPQKHVEKLYERLNSLAQKATELPVLHKQIGQELDSVVDWQEMAKLTLASRWTEETEPHRKEFTELLHRMVLNTYVKRFKPGAPAQVSWRGVRKPSGDKVIVATTVKVNKTSADVEYALQPKDGRWQVYDIVVDEASQVQTYKQSFKKVLDREGWDGLMKRMKKAADKKVE